MGTRPNDRTLVDFASPVKANRIVLNMIRPAGIVKILQNTDIETKDGKRTPVSKFLNLESTNKVEEYAEKLYQQCAGHPRTLAAVLRKRCDEIERIGTPPDKRPELITAGEDLISSEAVELLEETAMKFSRSIRVILKECGKNKADLDIRGFVDGFTYEHLLPPLRIGVKEFSDGSIQLRVPDRIRLRLEALVSPLHEYLSAVNTLSTLPIDFSYAFEILIAKVFNKFFQYSRAPIETHKSFFGSAFFGNWTDFACDSNLQYFPKVTALAKEGDTTVNVRPEHANLLVEKAFNDSGLSRLWLLPAQKSGSPDLVHVSRSRDGKRILCIAVKNYSTSELSKGDIEDEIKKAELMIPDGEVYESVLVVACTKYDKGLEKRFNGSGFQVYASEKIQKLNEVIPFNLTSPERRRMFCGIENANELAGLEHLVKKTQAD